MDSVKVKNSTLFAWLLKNQTTLLKPEERERERERE